MKVDFLRRGAGFRIEFDFKGTELASMEQLLQIIPLFASKSNYEPARIWARLFQEINGHRFIANGVREWWMEKLIEEDLILEAETREHFDRLVAAERGARGN